MKNISKLQFLYLFLAFLGLLLTWTQNIYYLNPESGGLLQFIRDTFVNRASTSITLDIVVLFVVCCIWMVIEGRKLKMKNIWLYIIGGLCVAISVSFPLFLYFRESKLRALNIR
ncbi:MAG: DUF2834 domain-containing protein [Deltaproteobacteria bacterium]|nr:MAG: DUF2834 domain-containing protein [Deltaproteobacteria bacterium]